MMGYIFKQEILFQKMCLEKKIRLEIVSSGSSQKKAKSSVQMKCVCVCLCVCLCVCVRVFVGVCDIMSFHLNGLLLSRMMLGTCVSVKASNLPLLTLLQCLCQFTSSLFLNLSSLKTNLRRIQNQREKDI